MTQHDGTFGGRASPTTLSPIARQAIMALDHLGVDDRATALETLNGWARRGSLSDADLRIVLLHYPAHASTDDTGMMFEREQEEPVGGPLPEQVSGHPMGRDAGSSETRPPLRLVDPVRESGEAGR